MAWRNPRSFWFLHTPTGDSWAAADPVSWSLEKTRQTILERARERLVTLDHSAEPQRVIRLVVRRCQVNLLELRPGRVIVHHWGQGRADLRPFFKKHGLARKGIQVALIERKRELTTVQTGDDFLYGGRLTEKFPLGVYLEKWRRQSIEEPDDWTPVPCSGSNYCWEGVEQSWIPWRVLKSAWRQQGNEA
jgi:hypothetical protein